MSSVPFHYVDLRAFCYATEDDKRVADALRTFLPEETELERAESEGFHGDRILVLSARLERADDGDLPDRNVRDAGKHGEHTDDRGEEDAHSLPRPGPQHGRDCDWTA